MGCFAGIYLGVLSRIFSSSFAGSDADSLRKKNAGFLSEMDEGSPSRRTLEDPETSVRKYIKSRNRAKGSLLEETIHEEDDTL